VGRGSYDAIGLSESAGAVEERRDGVGLIFSAPGRNAMPVILAKRFERAGTMEMGLKSVLGEEELNSCSSRNLRTYSLNRGE